MRCGCCTLVLHAMIGSWLGLAPMGHVRPRLGVPSVGVRGSRIGQPGGRARMTDIDHAADIEVSRGFAQVTIRIPLTGPVSEEWLSAYKSLAHRWMVHSGNENAFHRSGEDVMEAHDEPDRDWIVIRLPAALDHALVQSVLNAALQIIVEADAVEQAP